MISYGYDIISADDGTIVAIRFIESFKFLHDPEDETALRLKGDYSFYIRTTSGAEYEVTAIEAHIRAAGGRPVPFEKLDDYTMGREIAISMYQRWLWLIKS